MYDNILNSFLKQFTPPNYNIYNLLQNFWCTVHSISCLTDENKPCSLCLPITDNFIIFFIINFSNVKNRQGQNAPCPSDRIYFQEKKK